MTHTTPPPARPARRTLITALWLAAALPLATAQTAPDPVTPCPTPPTADLAPAELYGHWTLHLWPANGQATEPGAATGWVRFERHPEYPGSVRGRLRREAQDRQVLEAHVSGDVTAGEFNLDESADGITMDAVWTGHVTPSGCTRHIRGLRRPAENRPGEALHFVLRKRPGWD